MKIFGFEIKLNSVTDLNNKIDLLNTKMKNIELNKSADEAFWKDRLREMEEHFYSDRNTYLKCIKKVDLLEEKIKKLEDVLAFPVLTEQDEHRKKFEGPSIVKRKKN